MKGLRTHALLCTHLGKPLRGQQLRRVTVVDSPRTIVFKPPPCCWGSTDRSRREFRVVSVLVEGEQTPREIAVERLRAREVALLPHEAA